MVLTPIMAPYRVPVFNALAARPDMRFRVLYLAETEPRRKWPAYEEEMEYDHRILPAVVRLPYKGMSLTLSAGLFTEFRQWLPEVVLAGGWHQPAHLMAFGLRRLFGYRFAWWIESNARDARRGTGGVERLKRHLASRADAVVVPGTSSAEYVTSLAVSPTKVFVAPNAVDNAFFTARGLADRTGRNGSARFLFAGRLDRLKGVDVLLEAWRRLPAGTGLLVLAGDGPLRSRIAGEVAAEKLDNVVLLGNLDREGLAHEYARADVFVFPSLSDPWGLVVNEAMAAGLPIITTSAPGAVDDMVRDDWNGIVVRPGDPAALAGAMLRLSGEDALRIDMGQRSLEAISSFSPDRCAEGVAEAARACAGGRLEVEA